MKSNKFISILSAIFVMGGCTIKPPDVVVTSEKTALENQLLGSSRKITDDPASVTAVWSRDFALDTTVYRKGESASNVDKSRTRRLVLAQIRRQTIQDHIDELKRGGFIGEENDGFIKVMSDTIVSYDEIKRIVAAENSDRAVIWEYYASGASENQQQTIESVRKDFAEIMARVSPTGTWIEDQQGSWVRK